MDGDIRSDDFTTTTLWHFRVGSDEFTCSTSLCQGDDDISLLLEHIRNLGLFALNDKGNLVFDGLAVGGEVV